MTRRELTSFNKPRDYANSQHNNYNKDYSSYRNYNSSGAGNYPPQQQSNSGNPIGQPNAHHRAYPNAGNLTNSGGHPIGKGNSLSGASTLGANRPPEANLAKAAQQSIGGGSGGVGQHPVHRSDSSERSSSPQIGDCLANTGSNDKLFSKWVPPSVNSRNENLTPDDRNNIVFRRVRG